MDTPEPDPARSVAPTSSPVDLEARRVELVLPQVAELENVWQEALFVPYGDGQEELGLADDHGGQATPWGPEYGAPDADGIWWIVDTNKRRVARYAPGGDFLGEVAIPGETVALQFPFVLDGRLWAMGAPERGMLATEDSAERIPIPDDQQVRSWPYTDWTTVYSDDGERVHTATVTEGEVTWGRADALRMPDGREFLARVDLSDRSVLRVSLPDAVPDPLRLELAFTAADPAGEPVEAGVEYAADDEGRIHLLAYGGVPDGPQLAGYTWIEPDGTVAPVEPVRNPFSRSDPAGPSHLRTVPGTSDVALVFVDDDGLRVFVRSH